MAMGSSNRAKCSCQVRLWVDQPFPYSKDTGPERLVCSREPGKSQALGGLWDRRLASLGRLYKLCIVVFLKPTSKAKCTFSG